MDDINAALRAELEAALAVLDPQIRGLHDLHAVSISNDLRVQIDEEISKRERRKSLIQNVLTQMDECNSAREQLAEDGYPSLPDEILPPELMDELRGEMDDLAAARSVFTEDSQAKTLSVSLGSAVPKS